MLQQATTRANRRLSHRTLFWHQGALAVDETGPVQLRIMLGDDMHRHMNWLAERGLLHNSYTCPQCQVVKLDCAARFPGRIPLEMPHQRASVRKDAFFKSKLPLGKLVWMLLPWTSDTHVHYVAWHLDISKQTLVDWGNFIRDVCAEDSRRNSATRRLRHQRATDRSQNR